MSARVGAMAVFVAVVVLAGCGPTPTHEKAIRTCGEGNVAYVDEHDGQFGCRGTSDED